MIEAWHLAVAVATVMGGLATVWGMVVIPQARRNRDAAEFRILTERRLDALERAVSSAADTEAKIYDCLRELRSQDHDLIVHLTQMREQLAALTAELRRHTDEDTRRFDRVFSDTS